MYSEENKQHVGKEDTHGGSVASLRRSGSQCGRAGPGEGD